MGYENLGTTASKLKAALINGHMKVNGWTLEKDGYSRLVQSADMGVLTEFVTRPDQTTGIGGGDFSISQESSDYYTAKVRTSTLLTDEGRYTPDFDKLRDKVDNILKGWDKLPDPALFTSSIQLCLDASAALTDSAVVDQGGATGAGPLEGYVEIVRGGMSQMGGRAVSAFNNRYYVHFSPTTSALWAVSSVAGFTLAAEKALWETARADITSALKKALTAAEAIVNAPGLSIAPVFTILGFATRVLDLFPGIGIAADLLGIAIDIGKEATKDEAEPISASSPTAVLTGLKKAVTKINQALKNAETSIRDDNIVATLNNARRTPDRFSIPEYAPIKSADFDDPDPQAIKIDPALIRSITSPDYGPLHMMASALDKAAAPLLNAYMPSSRPDGIGLSFIGPGNDWSKLRDLLYELIKDLSWNVEQSRELLALVGLDFEKHEDAVEAGLIKYNAELAQGPTDDPWDNKRPGTHAHNKLGIW